MSKKLLFWQGSFTIIVTDFGNTDQNSHNTVLLWVGVSLLLFSRIVKDVDLQVRTTSSYPVFAFHRLHVLSWTVKCPTWNHRWIWVGTCILQRIPFVIPRLCFPNQALCRTIRYYLLVATWVVVCDAVFHFKREEPVPGVCTLLGWERYGTIPAARSGTESSTDAVSDASAGVPR